MADEYFGEVRWNEDDLRNALEENDVKSTDERVAQLRKLCGHTDFEDAMICAGWDIIYGYINNGRINTTRFSEDEIDRAAARLCMDRERAVVLLRNWDNGCGDVDDVIDRERAVVLLRNWDNGCGDVDDVIDRYEDGPDV